MNDESNILLTIIDAIAAHKWAGLGGTLCALFVVLLTDRAQYFPKTWNSPLRTVIGTLVGALGLTLNQVQDGGDLGKIALSVLATTLPTLVAELAAIRTGKGGTSGATGKADRGPEETKPEGKSLKMVGFDGLRFGLAIGALTFLLPDCAVSLQSAHSARVSEIHMAATSGGATPTADRSRCDSLDNQHRTWGALAEFASVLAGTGGIMTLPIADDQKTLRAVDVSAALVLGAFAATAVFVQQDTAATWARECSVAQ